MSPRIDGPQRVFPVAPYNPAWEPVDKWELAVWRRLPVDGTRSAADYWKVVAHEGRPYPLLQAALARLCADGRARAWTEVEGVHLAARGPFRACDACGGRTPPGPCRWCEAAERREGDG